MNKVPSFFVLTSHLTRVILPSVISISVIQPVDTGDFRLIDRKVCNALKQLPERNRYVRGLVSWVGFKQTQVDYNRDERFAGETKYPLKKMIKFATDGITAFSYKPLKFVTYLGAGMSVLSFISILIVLYENYSPTVPLPDGRP